MVKKITSWRKGLLLLFMTVCMICECSAFNEEERKTNKSVPSLHANTLDNHFWLIVVEGISLFLPLAYWQKKIFKNNSLTDGPVTNKKVAWLVGMILLAMGFLANSALLCRMLYFDLGWNALVEHLVLGSYVIIKDVKFCAGYITALIILLRNDN